MKISTLLTTTLLLIISSFCWAQETKTAEAQSSTSAQAEAQKAPNLFFSYNYYHYQMKGHDQATTNIYKFGESTVDLSLLTVTWMQNPNWTFVGLVPHISNRVETVYTPGTSQSLALIDTTKGLGDLRLMAITPVSVDPAHLTFLDIGVTAPTGSINEYFTSNTSQRAAYNMQLGSGTTDLVLGATVTNTTDSFVSSVRGQATIRGGRNANGYALGNEFVGKVSSIYGANPYISSGVVGNYRIRGAIVGKDEKYEIFNNYQNPSAGIGGDGHQFYHAAQQNWDVNLMAKAQTPAFWKRMNAALEVGVPFAQGMENKDDVDLNIIYYAAASLNASF